MNKSKEKPSLMEVKAKAESRLKRYNEERSEKSDHMKRKVMEKDR
ncbi:hypothetical protein [uncultured Clostridium sp.]|nr:hypothetical protein [uncultured Clostridium sp.]